MNTKPKENNKIRTVINMDNNTISWYIIGGELFKNHIGSVTIPASMSKLPLFPYFELYWENNKVKVNT